MDKTFQVTKNSNFGYGLLVKGRLISVFYKYTTTSLTSVHLFSVTKSLIISYVIFLLFFKFNNALIRFNMSSIAQMKG